MDVEIFDVNSSLCYKLFLLKIQRNNIIYDPDLLWLSVVTGRYQVLIPWICKCYFIWKKKGGGFFVDVTKLRILRWRDFPGLSSGPWISSQKSLLLYKVVRRRVHTDTLKRYTEGEVLRSWRQRLEWCLHNPRKCLEPPDGGRGKGGYSPEGFGGKLSWWHHDFSLVAFRTVREDIPVVLGH